MSREPRTLERPDGSRLYYEVGGRGAPLVLIRGLSRSSAYWFDFRDLLEQHRTVLVLDNRGVGRSSTPRGPWSTEDMADDVADVLRDSGVERADVFGISLGGMVAQHLALRHPHRVKRLMLACTTPGGRGADRLIHPDNSRRLAARIPGSRLEWLEGAGHDFPTERPHATRDHVLAFTA